MLLLLVSAAMGGRLTPSDPWRLSAAATLPRLSGSGGGCGSKFTLKLDLKMPLLLLPVVVVGAVGLVAMPMDMSAPMSSDSFSMAPMARPPPVVLLMPGMTAMTEEAAALAAETLLILREIGRAHV